MYYMQLNKQEIYVGQVFKNYGEMCEKLNIKRYKAGCHMQMVQLTKLKAYFDFERVEFDGVKTHQIRITKVYANEVLTIGLDKSKHQEAIEVLEAYDLLG